MIPTRPGRPIRALLLTAALGALTAALLSGSAIAAASAGTRLHVATTAVGAGNITWFSSPDIDLSTNGNNANAITSGPDGALWFTNPGNNTVGRITIDGKVTDYGLGPGIGNPWVITTGPDGALWVGNWTGQSIDRITTTGSVTTFPGTSLTPTGIASGGGYLWYTQWAGQSIGRISTSGTYTDFTASDVVYPQDITEGSDGAMWFIDGGVGGGSYSIGRITQSGAFTFYPLANWPGSITAGPDGALWFSYPNNNAIGRITTSGVLSSFTSSSLSGPGHLAAGPDGAIWFTESNAIGRITTGGQVTSYPAPGVTGGSGIAAGPDGAMWFTDPQTNTIGRITTGATITVTGWGAAQQVPGLAALNTRGNAQILSVSCPRVGDCSAGGYYTGARGSQSAFVVSETDGLWGSAQQVPRTRLLNAGGDAEVLSVWCPSAGNCAAGGFYTDSKRARQAFVVNESHGHWGNAEVVRGAARRHADAQVNSVSCWSAGNCSAGGWYGAAPCRGCAFPGIGSGQAFVVSERDGHWGRAQAPPGMLRIGDRLGDAGIVTVSCAAGGYCSAGGFYKRTVTTGSRQHSQYESFAVDQSRGRWSTAREISVPTELKASATAELSSVSCAVAEACGGGGFYTNRGRHAEAYVVSQRRGAWLAPEELAGSAALNAGGSAQVTTVSCASAGNCSAGGYYTDASGHRQAFVASETDGSWTAAVEVPGLAVLNAGGSASVSSVSCPTAGNCSAGGYYTDATSHRQAFVVTETGGTWETAVPVPALASLNAGGSAGVSSVSCSSADNCGAGGYYTDGGAHGQGFVVDGFSNGS